MTSKLSKIVTYFERLSPIRSDDLWSRGLAWPSDKLKPLYLHYHNFYYHETWKVGHLLWEAPTHNVTWILDQVVWQNRSRNKLKLFYFNYYNAYGHQIWQANNLHWWASTYKAKSPLYHLVLLRSCDTITPLYLHYYNTCNYQAW